VRTKARRRAAHLGPERRRPLILDAAFAIFLERGYEGAAMEAIARRAGVTKPVVYDSFASKEELFTELLEREEQRIRGQIAAALPARADADPERTLAEALTAFLRAVEDSPDAYRVIFLGEGGANAAVAERIQRGRAEQVDAVSRLARAWLEQRGESDPQTTARLIAHALVGVTEAAARALLAEPDRYTPERMGPMLAALIARGQLGVGSSGLDHAPGSDPAAVG
jgi:AcrR family transcriptional regulator